MLTESPAGLDLPFLLLPFRPTSDPSAARTFVRHFFEAGQGMRGDLLIQELRMTEPMVSLACRGHMEKHWKRDADVLKRSSQAS
jgi:hypothetical protein